MGSTSRSDPDFRIASQGRRVNAGAGRALDRHVVSGGFELTEHAATVIAEREIDIAWITRVLTAPERTHRERFDPALVHAMARIAERGQRVLRVVYNPSVKPVRIVTCYFDRRERGQR